MRKCTIRLISISIILILTFFMASSGSFAASRPVLKKGMSGSEVKTLQLNLKKLGFFSASATGYYGDITVAAVKKFQKKYGIPTTGVVASLTYSKLDSLLKPKPAPAPAKPKPDGLKAGNSGEDVMQLQNALRTLGYMKVKPTGDFGNITENALMVLQKKYGIEQHGVADVQTIALIDRLLGQDGHTSRGADEREVVLSLEIEPKYEVTKQWIQGIFQAPYIDGIGKYKGVVFHYTDNPGDDARKEYEYVKSNWRDAFVHEFIDADEIIQIADPDYKAWGAGKYANDVFIHLELCHESTREEFELSYKKIIRRIAEYLYINQLGVSPAKADGSGTLWGHMDVTSYLGGTDHSDPVDYLAKWGITWDDVIRDVTEQYDALSSEDADEAVISDTEESGDANNAGKTNDGKGNDANNAGKTNDGKGNDANNAGKANADKGNDANNAGKANADKGNAGKAQ